MGFETAYGVDFSGARDAGDHIWVSTVDLTADEPTVLDCQPATDALEAHYRGAPTAERDATLAALASFVASRSADSVIGFDFPFSVPEQVARGALGAETWPGVVDAVAACGSADAYAEACAEWAREHTDRTYLKRDTDAARGALSPYHFFVNAQAYHGMADVLTAVRGDATVVPFDPRDAGPVVAEVYPAATLDALGRHREGYKGNSDTERRRREQNLTGILDHTSASVRSAVRERVVADAGGDALDSLVAAVAAARNVGAFDYGTGGVEGRIYV